MSTPGEILLAQRAIADSALERATQPPPIGEDPLEPSVRQPTEMRRKSAGRAFLYNLLIPGAGHVYAGYKRGWANVGMEGLTWVTYFYYHDRGKTKEDEFEAYADVHYSLDQWRTACGCAGTGEDSLITYFYENNRQHYYEDIGKLPNYFPGWENYNPASTDSPNRRYYRGIRNDSNNFFKNARYALMFGFVNRIVSAVDVLRLVRKGKSVDIGPNTSLRFKMRTKPFNRENAFGVTITTRM